MKQRLMILNLLLAAGIVTEAWQLRQNWIAARTRESAFAKLRMKPPTPPAAVPSAAPRPVTATGYADIVENMLFSKDRNPTVEVVLQPEAPRAPMPALPLLYGVLNLPDGIAVIMGEKSGAKHKGVRPGDQVGPFTLVAANDQEITLEWEGTTLTKTVSEMIDRSAQAPEAPATKRAAASPTPSRATAPAAPKGEAAPGTDVGNQLRSCQPGDTSPAGTVSGGYRKVVTQSPFGDMCRWQPL